MQDNDYQFPPFWKFAVAALAAAVLLLILFSIPMTDEAKSCWTGQPVNPKFCAELGFLKFKD